MSENRTAFRIIEAADTPMSIGPGDLALTIAWPDGQETVEHVSERAAAALGYQRPEQPPAPPAWMVEVAREANARECERQHFSNAAAAYRSGSEDEELAVTRAIASLRLALDRGHVVEPRPAPTEEEMLKAAREDAAQAVSARPFDNLAAEIRLGVRDEGFQVQSALQARRNMLREGAVGASPAPLVDLEAALKRAWDDGVKTAEILIVAMRKGSLQDRADAARHAAVAHILSTLPTREA